MEIKPKIIYVGDPMCSWCYGVSNELQSTLKEFEDHCEFELVMGGLRPYNTQTMNEIKDFLGHHWKDVSKASGMHFNYEILEDTTITYDTEPPCRAVVVVKQMDLKKAFPFFKAVQAAFYKDNKNMQLVDSYVPILRDLGLSVEEFEKAFASDKMKAAVRKDFERSASLGVNSFPTLLLEKDGKIEVIARGFATKEAMIAKISNKLTKSKN